MSITLYRWLLWLYPVRFRTEYGDAMLQLFTDRLNRENRLLLWVHVLADTIMSLPREYRRTPSEFALSEAAVFRIALANGHLSIGSTALAIVFGGVIIWVGDAPVVGVVLVWLLLAYGTFKSAAGTRRQCQYWRGFGLILSSDQLVVTNYGSVASTIARSDVTRLVEQPGFGLIITTDNRRQYLQVPWTLAGYKNLRDQLSEWRQIRITPRLPLHSRFGGSVTLMIFLSTFLVRSPYVFFPLGAYVGWKVAWLTVWAFRDARLPSVPGRLKDPSWVKWTSLLVVTAIMAKGAWTLLQI